jgi:DNA adenine methylase
VESLNPQSTIHNPQSAIAIDAICRFGPNEGEANAILNLQSGSVNPQSTIRNPQLSVRPLLKWAGGKRQLLPAFRRFYPREFGAYFEPFVGSGAVFFDLHAARALDGRRVVLTDSNRDLVGCYRTVRDDPAGVVAALERLARGHATEGERHYYAVRDQFNDQRRQLPARTMAYTPALAAMLIYLNRTGFNGLFRLNGDGRFNVPVGRYTRPRIVDRDHIFAISRILSRRGVSIALAAFDGVLKKAQPRDFLYFDPPYAPLSATARFTSYTASAFSLADHTRLRDVAATLAARGCYVMVSNSSAPAIASLYEDDPTIAAAGLRLYRLPARRAINSRSDARGEITELLLTNLESRR